MLLLYLLHFLFVDKSNQNTHRTSALFFFFLSVWLRTNHLEKKDCCSVYMFMDLESAEMADIQLS